MIKKIFIFLTILLLSSGCTKKNYEEISFSSWGSVTEVKIIKKLLSDFEKQNPNIKVNFIHIPQNYFQKIHMLLASNTAPDVIFINNLYLPLYEQHLESLNSHIEKQKYYKASIEALSYENKILAIPRDISNLVFYVNLDLINLPKENYSIENLLEICKEITQNNRFGISYENDIYWALPYLTYFGGGLYDKNLNNIFNTNESQKGLVFYKDLKDKYKVAPTKSQVGSSTQLQMFLDKKIAVYLSGRWSYPKIQEKANFNWSILEFPNGKNAQYADASGWAIYKKTKNKKAAIKLVKFLSNTENTKLFAEIGLIVPANIEASKYLNNKEHNQNVFLKVAQKSTKTPVSKNYKKQVDFINSKFLDK